MYTLRSHCAPADHSSRHRQRNLLRKYHKPVAIAIENNCKYAVAGYVIGLVLYICIGTVGHPTISCLFRFRVCKCFNEFPFFINGSFFQLVVPAGTQKCTCEVGFAKIVVIGSKANGVIGDLDKKSFVFLTIVVNDQRLEEGLSEVFSVFFFMSGVVTLHDHTGPGLIFVCERHPDKFLFCSILRFLSKTSTGQSPTGCPYKDEYNA